MEDSCLLSKPASLDGVEVFTKGKTATYSNWDLRILFRSGSASLGPQPWVLGRLPNAAAHTSQARKSYRNVTKFTQTVDDA